MVPLSFQTLCLYCGVGDTLQTKLITLSIFAYISAAEQYILDIVFLSLHRSTHPLYACVRIL